MSRGHPRNTPVTGDGQYRSPSINVRLYLPLQWKMNVFTYFSFYSRFPDWGWMVIHKILELTRMEENLVVMLIVQEWHYPWCFLYDTRWWRHDSLNICKHRDDQWEIVNSCPAEILLYAFFPGEDKWSKQFNIHPYPKHSRSAEIFSSVIVWRHMMFALLSHGSGDFSDIR